MVIPHLCEDRSGHDKQSFPGPAWSREDTVLAGKRAVIVEDEGITQLQLRYILERRQVKVVGTAANGLGGVRLVETAKPDLVLMDIKMPVMSGLEAAEIILASVPTCIVFITAYSNAETRARAFEKGACGYVVKPITSDTLIPQLVSAYHRFQTARD